MIWPYTASPVFNFWKQPLSHNGAGWNNQQTPTVLASVARAIFLILQRVADEASSIGCHNGSALSPSLMHGCRVVTVTRYLGFKVVAPEDADYAAGSRPRERRVVIKAELV